MEQTIDTYRFSSGTDPSEKILSQLICEAISKADEENRILIDKWFKENIENG